MYCTDAQHFGRSGWGWCPRARGGSRTCACLCARLVGMSALVGFGNEATGVAGQRPRAGAQEGCHPIFGDMFLDVSGWFCGTRGRQSPKIQILLVVMDRHVSTTTRKNPCEDHPLHNTSCTVESTILWSIARVYRKLDTEPLGSLGTLRVVGLVVVCVVVCM